MNRRISMTAKQSVTSPNLNVSQVSSAIQQIHLQQQDRAPAKVAFTISSEDEIDSSTDCQEETNFISPQRNAKHPKYKQSKSTVEPRKTNIVPLRKLSAPPDIVHCITDKQVRRSIDIAEVQETVCSSNDTLTSPEEFLQNYRSLLRSVSVQTDESLSSPDTHPQHTHVDAQKSSASNRHRLSSRGHATGRGSRSRYRRHKQGGHIDYCHSRSEQSLHGDSPTQQPPRRAVSDETASTGNGRISHSQISVQSSLDSQQTQKSQRESSQSPKLNANYGDTPNYHKNVYKSHGASYTLHGTKKTATHGVRRNAQSEKQSAQTTFHTFHGGEQNNARHQGSNGGRYTNDEMCTRHGRRSHRTISGNYSGQTKPESRKGSFGLGGSSMNSIGVYGGFAKWKRKPPSGEMQDTEG